jgi:hypothetical protein
VIVLVAGMSRVLVWRSKLSYVETGDTLSKPATILHEYEIQIDKSEARVSDDIK